MRELNVAPIQYLEDLEDLDNMYESYIVAPLHGASLSASQLCIFDSPLSSIHKSQSVKILKVVTVYEYWALSYWLFRVIDHFK